ncbi:MAG TPA: hypothetical protein DD727_08660, partial [Clostridiales bacterium]|nr:hypothetical protein [Clostridiales bacterium]
MLLSSMKCKKGCRLAAGLLLCALLFGLVLGGCKKDASNEPASSTEMSEEEAMQLKGKVPVKIYLASQDGQMLKLVVRYVPENEMQGDTA